jgi:hypothetical protein
MNQPNNGNWSATPWLGEFAPSQFALWRAGCEWAAKSNWFAGNLAMPITPPVDAPAPKVFVRDDHTGESQ